MKTSIDILASFLVGILLGDKMKEKREGWKWVETSTGGFWSQVKGGAKHSHKLPLFCPHCRRITGTIDDSKMEEYGVCSKCYVLHIEARDEPTIDVAYYQERFKNQGY